MITAGYVGSRLNEQRQRELYICEVNSKIGYVTIKPVDPSPEMTTTPRQVGDPPSPNMVDPLAKSGDPPSPKVAREHLNKTNLENKEKETGDFLPDDKPIEQKEDATAVFQKAREYWNSRGLKPECRDIIIRPADVPEILRTMQFYSWDEIKNAIGNYAWHKTKAGPGYLDPPPYGSLYGFLKTGVERYFDDNALDQQFKRETK